MPLSSSATGSPGQQPPALVAIFIRPVRAGGPRHRVDQRAQVQRIWRPRPGTRGQQALSGLGVGVGDGLQRPASCRSDPAMRVCEQARRARRAAACAGPSRSRRTAIPPPGARRPHRRRPRPLPRPPRPGSGRPLAVGGMVVDHEDTDRREDRSSATVIAGPLYRRRAGFVRRRPGSQTEPAAPRSLRHAQPHLVASTRPLQMARPGQVPPWVHWVKVIDLREPFEQPVLLVLGNAGAGVDDLYGKPLGNCMRRRAGDGGASTIASRRC